MLHRQPIEQLTWLSQIHAYGAPKTGLDARVEVGSS